jgi:hypothetical protein
MKTRADLVIRALYNLGVVPHGQNPGDQEFNSVDALVEPMVEDLIARDIWFERDVDAIEEKSFLHLGDILAGRAAAVFGMQNDPALAARAQRAETDLNEMDRNTLRYLHMRTMRTDYYPRAVDTSSLFPST